MKLKQLLKIITNDTYIVFEENNLSSLGACYKDDFKKTFKKHIYLDTEIKSIKTSKIRELFSDKEDECLLVAFKG